MLVDLHPDVVCALQLIEARIVAAGGNPDDIRNVLTADGLADDVAAAFMGDVIDARGEPRDGFFDDAVKDSNLIEKVLEDRELFEEASEHIDLLRKFNEVLEGGDEEFLERLLDGLLKDDDLLSDVLDGALKHPKLFKSILGLIQLANESSDKGVTNIPR